MRAPNFETVHPILLHQAIIAGAFAAYLVDPEDIVWRFIKQSPNSRLLEHVLFFIATVFVGAGAAFCTRTAALQCSPSQFLHNAGYVGEGLFAVGLASLAPLWGAVLLIAGESLRLLRLALRNRNEFQTATSKPAAPQSTPPPPDWPRALRIQAAKWGIFVTMILFSVLLIDRVAETMAAASVLIWMLLNLPDWFRTRTKA
jgi:hypothetical protein